MSDLELELVRTPLEDGAEDVRAAIDRARTALGRTPLSPDLWRWRLQCPDGAALGVARRDGRVLAAMLGLEHAVLLEGEPARFLEVVELVNDFGAGRGLARARPVLELAEAYLRGFGGRAPEGAPVAFGFPTRRAHRLGLARLKTEVLRSEEVLVGPYDRLHLHPDHEVSVERADEVPDEVDGLFPSFAEGRGAVHVRDARRLRWRYRDHPERSYSFVLARRDGRLVGYAVVRMGEYAGQRGAVLCDWVAPDDDPGVLHALLAALCEEAAATGDRQVLTGVSSRSPAYDLLQFAGFRVHDTREYAVFRGFQKPYIMSWLFDHWHLTLGDTQRG